MEVAYRDYIISDDKSLVQLNSVHKMLSGTYWAEFRSREVIEKAIENSLCFGIYKDGAMVGFARCVTDYSALYYLCDVVVNDGHRGKGLGKALVKAVTEHERLSHLLAMLDTNDAHGLYKQFGFEDGSATAMRRKRPG
ncbi:MAG: GNAT family N-acetyltransferase [Oscillospiraceae bacterium]|nr:GNAT family N-acetyltransferase [Oscillospiraceae bacterium]